MNGKKTIFIGIIVAVVALVLIIVILLLSQLSNITGNNNSPASIPVSNPNNVNIIDLNNPKGGVFEYAVIRPDDTIELRNKLNEKFIIGLEKRNWKSLKWSPDGKLVAVLGKSTPVIYDIYIYNLAQKEWSIATDFKNFSTGVDQYNWVENNTILFTQGEDPTRWIHRFNYVSKEILKVANVSGDIVSQSPDLKYIVVKADNAVPQIFNASGELQEFPLGTLTDAETANPIALNEIKFFNNSEKVLARDVYGDFYKFNLGDNTAVRTTINSSTSLVCSLTENSFNGFTSTSNTLSYGTYSSKDNVFNILGEESFKLSFTVDLPNSYCANGSIYLKLLFADGSTQWYKQEATKIEADGVLDGNLETDIIEK